MDTPQAVLQKIGLERAAAALGVAQSRVKRAQWEPKLPAAWFDTLEGLHGEPMPRTAFAFKRAGQ